jgi:hypothetical protein
LESNKKILKNHIQIHGVITAIYILVRIAFKYQSFTFWLGVRFALCQALVAFLLRHLSVLATPTYSIDQLASGKDGKVLQDAGVDLAGKGIHEYSFDVIYILWFTFLGTCVSEYVWYATLSKFLVKIFLFFLNYKLMFVSFNL